MNILWVGNFSSQSGYANQARLFVPRLAAAGHRVTVFELGGGGGMPREVGGIQIVPTHLDTLGNDLMRDHAERLRADVVVTLTDAWAFRPEVMQDVFWCPLVPVDHLPLPPAVDAALKACRTPLAIARYGMEQLTRAGYTPLYVPHALDPDIWHPRDRAAIRGELGIAPDAFLVAFVGVNDSVPSRKGIPELLTAWAAFAPQHPKAALYLHTSEQGNLPVSNVGGVRIDLLVKLLDLDPQRIKLPDPYRYKTGFPARELASIVAAADVLVLPTRGEGFGLPLIEAQACGTPVITTAFAAGEELCASGWWVDYEPVWSWQSAFSAQPSVVSLAERLEQAYAERGNPQVRAQALDFARQYDVETVFSRFFLPAMRQLAEQRLDSVRVG